MMSIIHWILGFCCTLLFIYLAACTFYLLFFAVLGCLRKPDHYTSYPDRYTIAVLIPAYREDAIICDTVRRVFQQSYPRDLFEVVVIADSLSPATMEQLAGLPVTLIPLFAEKSTKSRALRVGLEHFAADRFDLALVLDADNVLEPDALEQVNHAFHSGISCCQLHRTAKNRNTPVSVLEGVSEEINNHIFRKGHRAAGLTSALIGSGMVFRFRYFRELLARNGLDDIPGYEDREIEMILIRDQVTVEFLDEVRVLDEKVPNVQILEKQRTRWVSGQLHYLRRFLLREPGKLLEFRLNYWDKVLQTMVLPRVLLLGLLSLAGILSVLVHFFRLSLPPGNREWIGIGLLYYFVLAISIPASMLDRKFLSALWFLPRAAWAIFRALVRANPGQTHFVHTPKDFPSDPGA